MSLILPIDSIKAEFLAATSDRDTVVLSAEPGAGKSTRLPLWLLDSDNKEKIYLVQPRRIAAKSVSHFLAAQLGEKVGQTVGYRLRDDTKVSSATRIEVITEGVLIQIIQNDPEITNCQMIILDEFHERSVQADVAFALIREVQENLREDLTLVLMSATLANDELKVALPDAQFLSCKGRSYPISYQYQAYRNIKFWRDETISAIRSTLQTYQQSILVFLPGSGDIQFIAQKLAEQVAENIDILPLYGGLTLAEQQRAVAPSAKRKVVLATNVAETSLTIEGVGLVIDSGLEKVACFDDNTLTNHLIQRNIARSSAIQRAGRAGRQNAGVCIRLFSEEEFNRRPLQSPLAILQSDLLPTLIEAARWGVKGLSQLPLLDKPKESLENNAWLSLQALEIVDQQNRLTQHGEQVSRLSCHPRFAHMIVKGQLLELQYKVKGLTYLACVLAALLEERDIFSPSQAQDNCDIRHRVASMMRASNNRLHQTINKQMKRLLDSVNGRISENLPIEYCGILLALAYPERIAKARKNFGEYIAAYGKGLTISKQDALANENTIVAAHVSGQKQGLLVRLAASVDIELLLKWQLCHVTENKLISFDNRKQRIIAVEQRCLGAIVLDERPLTKPPSENELFDLWLTQLKVNGIDWLNWRESDKALLSRWRWLAAHSGEDSFPDVSARGLLASAERWLAPFIAGVTSKAQLDKLDLSAQLLSMLDYQQQQQLDKLAPLYFTGPTGRKCPIRYQVEQAPIVSLPMQEVYGLCQGPSVGDVQSGKQVPLVLELLSPAQRPIQVTQDLAGFWQSSYREVQKEMKAKYPKHYWPDDPANAKATNKTKKHIIGC